MLNFYITLPIGWDIHSFIRFFERGFICVTALVCTSTAQRGLNF